MKFLYALAGFLLLALVSCKHIDFEEQAQDDGRTLVTLRVSPFLQMPFPTRSVLSDAATHLDIAFYSADGTRVAKVNQKSSDADFGSPSLYLVPGTYTLTCIAHSGTGIATMTKSDEATFTNNKVTDTFLASMPITIGETSLEKDILLQRCVSMVRFVLTDEEIPAEVAQLKFYYTGGSSTLNPLTGFGSKQSKQTEIRLLSEAEKDANGHPVFEIYTFPHESDGLLKITVTPQTSASTDLSQHERVFSDVPISLNAISYYAGPLFDVTGSTSTSVSITLDPTWSTITHPF